MADADSVHCQIHKAFNCRLMENEKWRMENVGPRDFALIVFHFSFSIPGMMHAKNRRISNQKPTWA